MHVKCVLLDARHLWTCGEWLTGSRNTSSPLDEQQDFLLFACAVWFHFSVHLPSLFIYWCLFPFFLRHFYITHQIALMVLRGLYREFQQIK